MKKIFALLALVLGVVSCQTEPEGLDVNVGGEQEVAICVTIPETETRAGGLNSALGVFDNGVLTTDATMRYILQVYYKTTENGEVKYTASKERLVKYSDGKSVTFPVRLVPNRDYQFVVWADVVDAEADVDKHYNTADLTNVQLKRTWVAMDETRDAFTATQLVENYNSASSINIVLKRPFAKLRVVTTDMEALNNLGIKPTKATVTYSVDHYNAFNALAGKAIRDSKNRDIKHENFAIASYGEKVDEGANMTLFTDYFFAEAGEVVKFELTVYDQNGVAEVNKIKYNNFNTDIAVQRNYLTTIQGNILTDGKDVTVTVEDAFAQPEIIENLWDGKTVKQPEKDAEGNYLIYEGAELAWVADQVNGVTRAAANTFKGKTIKLMKDINLGGNRWTPIGLNGYDNIFNGTFDGQGHTIVNLVVNNNKCAGLFGGTTSATFKNLTIDGVELITNHFAGAIVAWTESGSAIVSIDNCHVKNAKITVTPELVNGKYDNGDKAGAIVGHAYATDINRCTAENIEITAFRDVAGIAGYASKRSITNCSVKNAVITSDQIHEYDGDKDGNAGVIVGRIGDPVTLEGNTTGENVTVIRKVDSTKEFEYALAERRNDDVIYVGKGEVVLPTSLAVSGINKLTVEGLDTAAAVQFSSVAGGGDGGLNCYADGTELIFKNIKVVSPNTGSAYTGGFGRAKSVLFDNCYYEGQYRSLSYVKFNKCTIDPKTSYIYTDYSNADFVECTFNCSEGKGIQVYNDGNTTDTTINVTDCTFTAAKQAQTWDGKPVTGIDINSNGAKFNVVINNCTTECFPEGLNSKNNLWNVKDGAKNLAIVTVDGLKVWDAGYEYLAGGILSKDGEYLILNKTGLYSFANEVNVNNNAFDGKTVKLAANIDLKNEAWTPVGQAGATQFKGTFDGNNKKISNLKINTKAQTGANYSSGLFGWLNAATVKNVLVSGAYVEGNHNVAVIAGYLETTGCTVENCDVENATIIGYHVNDDACGDKVGGVVGHAGDAGVVVKDCDIKNSTITAGRDAGQVVGAANTANVQNCTATNVGVSANGDCTGANVRNAVIGRLL